ncbi:MAG: nuclear transport factor 2 family protein [Acidobacteria bacterium]|nr:nuclear transport factor 2 family protein [Acidobacteriota bacterium]
MTATIVLLTLGVAMAQQGAKGRGGNAGAVAQALMDLENQWAKASKASDGDAIAPLLAEDFVALDSDGSLHSKSEVVARVKKAKWVTNEIGDMKVRVHGDSAVVTGSWMATVRMTPERLSTPKSDGRTRGSKWPTASGSVSHRLPRP